MISQFKQFVRRAMGRLTAAPFRSLALVLHMTGLERVFKPRLQWSRPVPGLTQTLVDELPKYCQTITGAQMDPMNLILIGERESVKRIFRSAGWHGASPASPLHLLYALYTSVTRRTYRRGPFSPLYINIGLQDLAFQKLTKTESFRQRHHVRIWRTNRILPAGQPVWVAACSYDTQIKLQFRPPFVHHRTDPNIDQERSVIVDELIRGGAAAAGRFKMTATVLASKPKGNAYGNSYFTDGFAVAIVVGDAI